METITVVSSEPAPSAEQKLLNKDVEAYRAELFTTVHQLGQLTTANFTLAERRQIAFAILGDDIPEEATREHLRDSFYSSEVAMVGRHAMRALDGGIGPHTVYGRNGVANPEPLEF